MEQRFKLGQIAYMYDEDFNAFEEKVTKVEIYEGEILYTADVEFTNKDIGDWVFESEMFREMHFEILTEQ
ncbi:MAG: hypothetical protein ACRCWG_02915 [Sarcina sp.]